jgi:hypothetical protein
MALFLLFTAGVTYADPCKSTNLCAKKATPINILRVVRMSAWVIFIPFNFMTHALVQTDPLLRPDLRGQTSDYTSDVCPPV